nr:HAD-IA family hydrolase [Anaerolineae bacterium]
MLKAVIFDFDGLILDTETPQYITWAEVYQEYGQKLPVVLWLKIVGSSYEDGGFHPIRDLETRTGLHLDPAAIEAIRYPREREMIDALPLLPGVMRWIEIARANDIKLAIASSSPEDWVMKHLDRFDLSQYFVAIVTADDVIRVKPEPDLFLVALDALNVQSHEAIVFEDSVHGIEAARKAGIATVAIPNELTRHFDFRDADRVVDSLENLTLSDVIALLK